MDFLLREENLDLMTHQKIKNSSKNLIKGIFLILILLFQKDRSQPN